MSALSSVLEILKGLIGMKGQPKKGTRVDVKPLPPKRKTLAEVEDEDTQPFPRRGGKPS